MQLYLLSGFLGAGKTTMMKAILRSYEHRKIGVIVNEFGEVNIDGAVLRKEGVAMEEVSNGSIFCACIKDKFVDSLLLMSRMDLEVLFIEASGLADPANFRTILSGIRRYAGQEFELKGCICIVDCVHFLDCVELLPALENQVLYANAAILNKADLVSPERIAAVSERVREINQNVSIFVTAYCDVDFQEVTTQLAEVEKPDSETTNTAQSRLMTMIAVADVPLPLAALAAFLKEIAGDSYRIKGFVRTQEGMKEISCTREHIEISDWPEEDERSRIVIISAVGIKMMSLILAASAKYLDDRLKLGQRN